MNKLLVITGGTKGIGNAIIEKFASQKFDIVTCARKAQELMDLKVEIESKHKVEVHVYTSDLSSRENRKLFSHQVNKINRPIDVLINNVGNFVTGNILEEPDGVLESMINTNLYSAYYTTRGLIETVKKSKQGYIFNICSVAGIKIFPTAGSYSISKFAMVAFSKLLREELKSQNIRVTTVMPGATFTGSWDGVDIEPGRLMKSEHIAQSIFDAYSMSPQSVIEEIIVRPQLGDI